jgi:hypothetical protein
LKRFALKATATTFTAVLKRLAFATAAVAAVLKRFALKAAATTFPAVLKRLAFVTAAVAAVLKRFALKAAATTFSAVLKRLAFEWLGIVFRKLWGICGLAALFQRRIRVRF